MADIKKLLESFNKISESEDRSVKAPQPRNVVAKNAKTAGAGRHKNPKEIEGTRREKHKKDFLKDIHEEEKQTRTLRKIEEAYSKFKKDYAEGKMHTSPSGVRTNMDPSDDDYEINYGKNGAAANMKKEGRFDDDYQEIPVNDYDQWNSLVSQPGVQKHWLGNHVTAQSSLGDVIGEFRVSRNKGYVIKKYAQGIVEGVLNKIADRVMDRAPANKYQVGQTVRYEMDPPQAGGSGVGTITKVLKDGVHYLINGKPVNHFEIKGVEQDGAEGINEGVMDQIKNIYRGILYDNEPLPDDKFLSVWQRSIHNHLGKTIDIDTLSRLHQEFRDKYRRLARRGEAPKWDQEMGQRVAEGFLVDKQVAYWDSVAKDKKNKERETLKAKKERHEQTPAGKAEKYWSKKGVAEGFGDMVKGIKRKIAGKEDPTDVQDRYARAARREIGDANKYNNPAANRDSDQAVNRYKKVSKVVNKEGVAEGLNEFAPDGFNSGDDDEGFSPEIAKMAQEDGFTKGVSLADGATLERAMKINYWHTQHGGMYKQYFAKGFKAGRMNKVKHDNKQYNLNLKLMKDGSIRHGEQGVAEGISVVDTNYDLDQMIVTLDIEGQVKHFTYWDYDENFENAERRDVFDQLQEQPWYKGLDHPTKMEILDAAYKAIRGEEPSEYRPTVGDEPLDEAGPFSYGAKKPRKGSVADLAAKKRREQERGRQPIEPRDQMVGVAKILPKDMAEDSETHKYQVVVKGDKRSYSVWVDAKNEEVAVIRAQQYVAREHNDTAKRAAVVDMKQGVKEAGTVPTMPTSPTSATSTGTTSATQQKPLNLQAVQQQLKIPGNPAPGTTSSTAAKPEDMAVQAIIQKVTAGKTLDPAETNLWHSILQKAK